MRRRAGGTGAIVGGGTGGGSPEPEIERLFGRALEIYKIYENDLTCKIRPRADGHISSSSPSDDGGDDHGDGDWRKIRPSEDKGLNKLTAVAVAGAVGGALQHKGNARVAAASHELGMCILGKPGRQAEAVELLKRALQIRESKLGPDDVQVAYTLHDVALCVGEAGSHVEAEELFRRALRIKEEKLGKCRYVP